MMSSAAVRESYQEGFHQYKFLSEIPYIELEEIDWVCLGKLPFLTQSAIVFDIDNRPRFKLAFPECFHERKWERSLIPLNYVWPLSRFLFHLQAKPLNLPLDPQWNLALLYLGWNVWAPSDTVSIFLSSEISEELRSSLDNAQWQPGSEIKLGETSYILSSTPDEHSKNEDGISLKGVVLIKRSCFA